MAMKQTLLEMTQAILLSMQGDEITAIADTEESRAVAQIIKENYFYITGKADLPEHKELFSLTETSASTPVIMTPPSTTTTIEWIKYNNKLAADTDNNFRLVTYLNKNDFLEMQNALNQDETTVSSFNLTIGSNTYPFKYKNDTFPEWWTTWNDNTILFNAVDETEETYLRATKTLAYGLLDPTWTHSDSFTPDLDNRQFTLLLNEAKAQCFSELKQVQNVNAERKLKHGWVELSRTKNNFPDKINAYSKIRGYGKRTR